MDTKHQQPGHDTPREGIDQDKIGHAPHGIPPEAEAGEAKGTPGGRMETETAAQEGAQEK